MGRVAAVVHEVPEGVQHTRDLAREFPDWPVEKIAAKLGIDSIHVAAEGECASDLAVKAAEKLFASGVVAPGDVDALLLLTQTPDYILPTTACLLQERLGLSQDLAAMDINLGCSGYVYGLGLATGLIATAQAGKVLLLTADTYSKLVHPLDRGLRALLGDAATATLVCEDPARGDGVGPFTYGTDGRRSMNIVVPAGGMRKRVPDGELEMDAKGNGRTDADVRMEGRGMFAFSAEVVPRAVEQVLAKAQMEPGEIDFFVFHQANQHMLEHLRGKLGLPTEKFMVDLRDVGNTGSSSIPIVLSRAHAAGRLQPGMRLLLVGYGVGLSWGACLLEW